MVSITSSYRKAARQTNSGDMLGVAAWLSLSRQQQLLRKKSRLLVKAHKKVRASSACPRAETDDRSFFLLATGKENSTTLVCKSGSNKELRIEGDRGKKPRRIRVSSSVAALEISPESTLMCCNFARAVKHSRDGRPPQSSKARC